MSKQPVYPSARVYDPNGGVVGHGTYIKNPPTLSDKETFVLRVGKHGELKTSSAPSASTPARSYRSSSMEQSVDVTSNASRLIYIKGWIDSGAADDDYFLQVLDKSSYPSDGTSLGSSDIVTLIHMNHNNGYYTHFNLDDEREIPETANGLSVGISLDPYTVSTSSLSASEQCHFEVEYIE